MTSIIVTLALIAAIGGGALWFVRRERQAGRDAAERLRQAEDIAARDRVAQAGAGPRGPKEVEDALRRGGL